MVFRGAVLAAPWKRALLHLALPAAAYPVTMLVAALWLPDVAAQLGDSNQLAGFIQYQFFVVGSVLIIVWGSHTVWAFRRQASQNRSIGRYRLERRIGVGGMGEVWRAYDKALKRHVALKLLPSDNCSASSVARFECEAEATSLLSHPNTVRICDYGVTHDGLWYYAMELLDGQDLAHIVRADGPLSPARALRLVGQAARALAEAHARGIVHRDIKPENLFVATLGGEQDIVKVLDFGIAKLAETEASVALTHDNWAGGTPAYMSPEAARGLSADARSDVYALGAVLYFAPTGSQPFRGDDIAALLDAHIQQQVVRPSLVRAAPIPEPLERLVTRCLAKAPGERYPDAGELSRAIHELSHRE